MRLTGWQRIGIIASVAWLPVGFWGYQAFASAQLATARTQYAACVARVTQAVQELKDEVNYAPAAPPGVITDAQFAQAELATGERYHSGTFKCGRIYQLAAAKISSRKWQLAVAAALLPVLLMWLVAWLFVRLYRWVRDGFDPSDPRVSNQENEARLPAVNAADKLQARLNESVAQFSETTEDLHGSGEPQVDVGATRATQEQVPASSSHGPDKSDRRSALAWTAVVPAVVAMFAAKQWSSLFVANVSSPSLAALVTGASVLLARDCLIYRRARSATV